MNIVVIILISLVIAGSYRNIIFLLDAWQNDELYILDMKRMYDTLDAFWRMITCVLLFLAMIVLWPYGIKRILFSK